MRAYRRREADSASDEARADRQADYRSKELQDSMVGKEESGHGFDWFIPPQGTPAFTDATLRVRFVDAQEATSFVMELGLTGLGRWQQPPGLSWWSKRHSVKNQPGLFDLFSNRCE